MSNALIYTAYENAIRFVPLGRNQYELFILAKVKPGADINRVRGGGEHAAGLWGRSQREQMRNHTVRVHHVRRPESASNFGITVLSWALW